MVVEIDDPVLGLVQQVAPAAKFPSLGPVHLTPAPTPGQHTEQSSPTRGTAHPSGGVEPASRRSPSAGAVDEPPARGRQDSRSRRVLRRAVLLAPAGRPRRRRHQARTHAGRPAAGDRSMLLPGPGRKALHRHGPQGTRRASPPSRACSNGPTSCTTICDPERPSASGWPTTTSAAHHPGGDLSLRPRLGLRWSRHAPPELRADDVRLRRRHLRSRRAVQRTPPDALQRRPGQRHARGRVHPDGVAAPAPDRGGTRDVHRESRN